MRRVEALLHPPPRGTNVRYFFLAAGSCFLLSVWRCLAWLEASFLDCFCDWFFCFDFGDLSPMGCVWFGVRERVTTSPEGR